MKGLAIGGGLFAVLLLAQPRAVHAQGTTTALGIVLDAEGKPVPDVQVLLEYKGHQPQRYRTKTDKNGRYVHVNVWSGPVRHHAEEGRPGRGHHQGLPGARRGRHR